MRLEVKNVSFRYDRKGPWILENCSLSVEKGEVLGLFAPSGFGKTTLAMLMAGYLQPTSGEILLDGRPLPKKGFCPVQLIYQHPEKAINPRWCLMSDPKSVTNVYRKLSIVSTANMEKQHSR